MKKAMYLPIAVAGLFLGAIVFNACQKETKETLISRTEEAGKKKPQANTKTCVHPIFYDKLVDTHCSDGHPCTISMIPTKNRNRVNWRVGTQCSSSQNYTYTSYYTLYKYAGPATTSGFSLYNRIATFNCTNPYMWYASSLLTNSSTFILIVSDLSTALPTSIHEQISTGYLYDTGGYFLSTYNYYSDSWKFVTGTSAGTVNCINKEPIDL
ncbi:hypothetical protein [Fluviicola sp.]|uniref:hypothetical protein n=1 Tax=Fluviicola sp. TaxID=1917219 RepID=UPI0031CE0F5A